MLALSLTAVLLGTPAAPAAPPLRAATVAQQPAGGSGGRPTLKGQQGRYTTTIQVAATPARAWSVLTDYTAMAGVMPDIKEVRVLRRQGPRVELQQTYQAPYTFGRRIKATLVMQETAPRQLTYQLIKGEQIRQLRGQWSITPVRGGVLLSHQLEVDPEMPSFVRPLYFELTETNLQQSMRILKRLMEAG